MRQGEGMQVLASDTAEKPRVMPPPEPREVEKPKAETPKFDEPAKPEALPPELLSDEAHRAAAERSAPWQVRHANRIRMAALVGITGGLAGLALYGWNTMRPSELDKLQITLPARSPAALVEPAPVQPPRPAPAAPTAAVQPKVVQPSAPAQTATGKVQQPAAPVQTAVVPVRVQPAPAPQPRVEAALPVRPASGRTAVTHTRAAAVSAAAAVPEKAVAERPVERSPNCAEGVAALGLCK